MTGPVGGGFWTEDLLWTGLGLAWGPARRVPVPRGWVGGRWKDHQEDQGRLREVWLELSGSEDLNWVAVPGCWGGGHAGSLLGGWGLVQHSAGLEEEMALGKKGWFSIQARTDSCLVVFSCSLFLKATEAEAFGA